MKSVLLRRLTSHVLSCSRGSCLLSGRISCTLECPLRSSSVQIRPGPVGATVPALIRHYDSTTQKYSMIYTLPHIKLLRAVSRLKLIQTAITAVILPPVYVLYFQGAASFFLVSYSTGIAVFAGVMLYTFSHFFRRVVGMMYLDPSQTMLKVSHLTFWGKRHDMYIPVSDVMTIGDTGDSASETILKLKRYSSPETLYFSVYFGKVVDRRGFEKVFGT
ncbi:transmembrane protein 186 isoform X2 [Oryzias melastigma]|nr:transmembrane protein 186 isoform X2 [Oryzias melastigma]